MRDIPYIVLLSSFFLISILTIYYNKQKDDQKFIHQQCLDSLSNKGKIALTEQQFLFCKKQK